MSRCLLLSNDSCRCQGSAAAVAALACCAALTISADSKPGGETAGRSCYARASMRKAEPGISSPAPPLLPSNGVIQADVSVAAAACAPSSASSAA